MDSPTGEVLETQVVSHFCRWSVDVIYCVLCTYSIPVDWKHPEPDEWYEAMMLEHQILPPVEVQVYQA